MIISLAFTPEQFHAVDAQRRLDNLAELIRAHRLGHHLIVIDRKMVGVIRDNSDLSEREKVTLAKIGDDYTQYGSIVNSATVRIDIDGPGNRIEHTANNIISISLDYQHLSELVSKPALVVEDHLADGRLFQFIMKNYKRNPFGFSRCYEISHGGGAQTISVGKKKAEERKIVLVVVDTDCDSPSGLSMKKTANSSEMGKVRWPLLNIISTPCREAENLLPSTVFICLSEPSYSETIDALDRIEKAELKDCSPGDSFRLFLI